MLEGLCMLHKELDIGKNNEYLVVAGDAKTYKHIQYPLHGEAKLHG